MTEAAMRIENNAKAMGRGLEGEIYDLRVALADEEERGVRNIERYSAQVMLWQGKYYKAQWHLVRSNWGAERLSRRVRKLKDEIAQVYDTIDEVERHAKWEQWRADAMYISLGWMVAALLAGHILGGWLFP